MAVLAQGSITIYHVKDIASVTWYYKLQSSTLSPPDKPTTSPPPTAWKTSEPSYNEGSTDSLYVVERTIFSDGTFSYSDVSLSSSYEAAKTAYNMANTASAAAIQAAQDAQTAYNLAGSKNKVFYSAAAPSVEGRADGDLWFDTDEDNKLYSFSSDKGAWVAKLFGNNALHNNINAGKIATGTLDASKVNVTNLNASNISTGTLDASQVEITNLKAENISSGYLSADRIANESITTRMLGAGAVTATKISVTDLQAIAAKIGAINISTTALYSGSHTTYNSSNAGFYLDKDGKFGVGNSAGYIRWNGSSLAIAASTLAWTSTYSSMTANGVLTAEGANIKGTITATSGSFGGWNANSYRLWKQSTEFTTGNIYQVYLQSAASSSGDDPTESTNAMVVTQQYTVNNTSAWKSMYELKYDGSLTSNGYELNGSVIQNTLRTILSSGGLEVRIGTAWNSAGSMSAYNYVRINANGISTNHYFKFGVSTHVGYNGYDLGNGSTTDSIFIGREDGKAYLAFTNSNNPTLRCSARSSGDLLYGYQPSDYLDSGNCLTRKIYFSSSSSKRYKDYIDDESEADALKLLDLPVVRFRYKDGYLDPDDENYDRPMVGLFAEDVAEQFEDAVYHKSGYIENYTDRQLLVRLIKLVQMQHREIEQLKQAAS